MGLITRILTAARKSEASRIALHNINMVKDPIYKGKYRAGLYRDQMKELGKKVVAGRAAGENVDELIEQIQISGAKNIKANKSWKRLTEQTGRKLFPDSEVGSTIEDVYGFAVSKDTHRLRNIVGISAGLGAATSLMSGENPIWGAVKFAAFGAMFETLFPVVASIEAGTALAEVGLSLNRTMNQMDQGTHIMRINQTEKYNPVGPPSPDVGNMRRKSASYQKYSKQNTNSFIGSEASFMHGTT